MISLESQELWDWGPDGCLGKEGGEKLRSNRGAVPVAAVAPVATARLFLLALPAVFTFTLGDLVRLGGKEDSK